MPQSATLRPYRANPPRLSRCGVVAESCRFLRNSCRRSSRSGGESPPAASMASGDSGIWRGTKSLSSPEARSMMRDKALTISGSTSETSFEIPALFKADTATVSFDAAKAGKLSRGFQDCEQIGSFEKSGIRGALGAARYRRERIERHRDGWRGIQRGVRHLCARSGGESPRFHGGGWRGWASMTLGAGGGQPSGRVVLFA